MEEWKREDERRRTKKGWIPEGYGWNGRGEEERRGVKEERRGKEAKRSRGDECRLEERDRMGEVGGGKQGMRVGEERRGGEVEMMRVEEESW